jgi:ribosome-associated protein
MEVTDLLNRGFYSELRLSATKSSGPGGQNVNKVSSKVELRFNVKESNLLSIEEKEIILSKLKNKINKDGELLLVSQVGRSQLANKEKVIDKFYLLLSKTLTPKKKRKITTLSKQSKEKRLEVKRFKSEIKSGRKKVKV